MKKISLLLCFMVTVLLSNAATKTVAKTLKSNETKKVALVKKSLASLSTSTERSETAKLKKSELCNFSFYIYADCPDGSVELYGRVSLAIWCDSGVININASSYTTIIPDCWLMTI